MVRLLMLYCNNEKIIGKVKFAISFFEKFKGLMFEKKENFDYALVFFLKKNTKLGASVHMLFVFFPICILYLGENKKVVEKAVLEPWTFNYTPKKPAKYFIELPVKFSGKIKIGDKISWEKNN